ncbi:methylthioadenosine nucleosidase [Shewanella denitrificans OS217]|jgi:adenosylhomocysteine nucleosidase|uniref:5'-methylthioadenosine/S-adenosylhomocysteine nucleosidase n=1 Tax=Shewanella denitrificans (strain OS217 / ATCC BAA-1090 / DSM 15013) TaxID=318161 RepID=MTNN_SHEDO|nr:5'-methylthioadenosine/adenosylhomocysteine nucleosidase [Shewanella denitrificans]Q12KE6.1 RecName: Full=5'-methylthioadenosine/S-adenosylhomocysteine nucleosidase; Short=MTA/SAH nucleosidase; Short=MTAN; AltName: Full=5'-deoxyadenosine nucleosidase; Short=DOA nucleosidase; Short=dAdo nucleosidase; AltName: Full=5'-methylthioadenosine nucleosidase; Short=MTA nucleosidase; AltName: Full=S-adenosylhomocysteine nucleosidase; Short=AdoHcy nucleosidase; Short=SAH nucleosidase; Short=SRH nucleosidas
MKIGIIGAMEPEVAHLIQSLTSAEHSLIAGIEFISGQIAGKDVVITRSGIGKVAASIATTLLIEKFAVTQVVNTGSAGGFVDSLKIGDIVISSEVRHHDVDVTAFGYEIGQMAQQPAAFIPDAALVEAAKKAVSALGEVKAIEGLICTGDSFICDPERTKVMRANFPTMAACEMEGAAIAQVCHQFKVPFVVIRSLSDNANNDSPVDFDSYIIKAGHHSAMMVVALLTEL